MAKRFARAVVYLRVPIVVGWLALATALVVALPTLEDAQVGALGDLVPAGADAIETEQRAAELFAFPLSSRTVVVERDPAGLPLERIRVTARRIADVNRGRLRDLRDAAGAYGMTNAVPGLSFSRERGTAALSYLLFPLDVGQAGRAKRGENYAEALAAPSSSFVGVTGAIPARAAQARTIRDHLPLAELATLVFIAIAVGVYARSVVAPLVTLLTVAVAYVTAVRVVAAAGEKAGVSVPAEVEPVVVALLFGVVTDYALFYISRYRRRLAEGMATREASVATAADLTPIILTCGLAVAAGAAALVFADLGFLRAFGPGMALSILVALLVSLTLLPAMLALIGQRLFWPSRPARGLRTLAGRSRSFRLIGATVRRPGRAAIASLLLLAAMASGLLFLELGNPVIRGLPPGSEPRVAYAQLSKAFAPGVVAPTTIVVEESGIAGDRRALAALQETLSNQPGVAGVFGPATNPSDRAFGAVLSRTRDAARFVVIREEDPLGATAVRRLANLQARMPDLLEAVGLPAATASFAGDTALVGEVIETVNADLVSVTPAVLLAVAIVVGVFLRAILAPLLLVVLAAIAPAASLGLAVGLFQGVLGQPEITYYVPIVATVLLVALGSDYNVFLAGRIWAEARSMPLRRAIVAGGGGAAHAIAAAGIVLAASFGALALVPLQAFRELAFVLAAGLLIDAFLVRGVLAPAVIALVGERAAWPRTLRVRRAPAGSPSG
ncbi:MAG: MMPL family transporter [Actinomycetota bacterium]|nr:MMPL family transporter [Actinomycetota bacterium]